MKKIISFGAAAVLAACAQTNLDAADKSVDSSKMMTVSLDGVARATDKLTDAYVKAAMNTAITQDVSYALTLVAAGAVGFGAVVGSPPAQIARYAGAGFAAQQTGKRVAPKVAIKEMYKGARRLNCVATAARVGNGLLVDAKHEKAGKAATVGAVRQIQIETRMALIREDPDYTALAQGFASALGNISGFAPASADSSNLDSKFREYQRMLNDCLEGKPSGEDE